MDAVYIDKDSFGTSILASKVGFKFDHILSHGIRSHFEVAGGAYWMSCWSRHWIILNHVVSSVEWTIVKYAISANY
jgi:hypothetical protein